MVFLGFFKKGTYKNVFFFFYLVKNLWKPEGQHSITMFFVSSVSSGFGLCGFIIVSYFPGHFFYLIADSARFRLPPQQWRVLSCSAVRGPEQTDSVRRPAHRCQARHRSELHLYPQDGGECRDPSHLLLLSGNRPVERAADRERRRDGSAARSTRVVSYELCWEGTIWDGTDI